MNIQYTTRIGALALALSAGLFACSNDDTSDAGSSADAAASTLYARLGGHAGIRSALDQVVAAELADPTIAPFFHNQTMTPVPAGHPTADQLTECLTNQLGAAAGGPEVFPGPLSSTFDGGAFTCRDMTDAHAGLGISSANFDEFVTNAANELTKLGVASADVMTIGSVLNSTKTMIVETTTSGDAGTGTDAGN